MNTERITGIVRVDENVSRLAARLVPGEIAVIDQPDIDRASAVVLLAKRPAAVLNASPSTTGRSASVGAQMLVGEGIPLIDSLGSDVMVLREGETIMITGSTVSRENQLIAEGQLRNPRELSERSLNSRGRLGIQVQAFAQGAHAVWEREQWALLDGDGVPRFSEFRKGRAAVVVAPGVANVRKLRSTAADLNAVIIGVEEGAVTAKQLGRGIDIFIGDPTGVPEKVLRKAAHLVLLQRAGGEIPGRDRIDGLGLAFSILPTSASAADAALLLADVNGAKEIVTAGAEQSLEEFFDSNLSQQLSGFFVRTRTGSRLVSAAVAERLHRPRVSAFWLVLMLIVALAVVGVAIWLTPWGQSLFRPISSWFVGWWPWGSGG